MKTFHLRLMQHPANVRRVLAVYWVLLAVGSHLPSLGVGEDNNQFGMFQVDKTLHVAAFAGLTLLLYLSRLGGRCAGMFRHALLATVIAAVYALVDEYTQKWTGRDLSLSDVVAGLIGILGVFLVLTAPKPRQRPTRFTAIIRIATAVILVGMLVVTLAPDGNRWVNRVALPFFQPWPQIDKAGHFYVSAALMLLIALSYPAGVHRPRLGVFLSIVVIGLAGPIIETAQWYTGRGVEMADLYTHQLGLLAAMAGLAGLAILRGLTHALAR